MPRDDALIADLCRELGLKLDDFSFQFLHLLPIVEVMWADGRCQKEEVETFFHHVEEFVRLVNHAVPEITTERARRFFLPLLEPSALGSPRMRAALARLVDEVVDEMVEPARLDKRRHLFEMCRQVADAADAGEGGGPGLRISAEEARALQALLRALRLDGGEGG